MLHKLEIRIDYQSQGNAMLVRQKQKRFANNRLRLVRLSELCQIIDERGRKRKTGVLEEVTG